MNLLDILLIGVALSMDACALTIANCTTYAGNLNKAKCFSMPVAFAIFQGVMPLIGYYVGSTFAAYLESFSGYLVAGVFFILAGKIFFDIIKEHLSKKRGSADEGEKKHANFNFGVLILQAIATSIDALVVGVTLSLNLTFSIFWAVLAIAGVTFALVLVALVFGKYLGKLLGRYANWAGALILTALAIKSLVEAII